MQKIFKCFLLIVVFVFPFSIFAQKDKNIDKNTVDTTWVHWQKIKEIDIDFIPKQVAKTRTGNFYITDKKGNVYFCDVSSLDKFLEKKVVYTPEKIAQISQIDAWQTQEVTLFYMDYQEFYILDRFLKPISKRELPNHLLQFVTACTPASDGNMWAWDSGTNSLKKFNPAQEQILSQTNISTILPQLEEININFIREYQYQVFLGFFEEKEIENQKKNTEKKSIKNDKKRKEKDERENKEKENKEIQKIFVFDLFGNLKKVVAMDFLANDKRYDKSDTDKNNITSYIDFWGDEFYTFLGNDFSQKNIQKTTQNLLYFIDIYTQKKRVQNLPDEKNVLFWIKTEEFLLKDDEAKKENTKENIKKIEIKEKWICFKQNKILFFENINK